MPLYYNLGHSSFLTLGHQDGVSFGHPNLLPVCVHLSLTDLGVMLSPKISSPPGVRMTWTEEMVALGCGETRGLSEQKNTPVMGSSFFMVRDVQRTKGDANPFWVEIEMPT